MPDWCCQGSHNFSLGTVYLQEKCIPSLVSFELENEDRLLLQDRDSGPRSKKSTRSTLSPFMLQEYHQATISAVLMVILFLMTQDLMWAVHAILFGFLLCIHTMRPRVKYHQAIISVVWVIILSLIPQCLARAGAILLGFLIIVHAMRPRILMKTLQLRLSSLEGNLQDAVDSGIMPQLDTSFTNQFKTDVGK